MKAFPERPLVVREGDRKAGWVLVTHAQSSDTMLMQDAVPIQYVQNRGPGMPCEMLKRANIKHGGCGGMELRSMSMTF